MKMNFAEKKKAGEVKGEFVYDFDNEFAHHFEVKINESIVRKIKISKFINAIPKK